MTTIFNALLGNVIRAMHEQDEEGEPPFNAFEASPVLAAAFCMSKEDVLAAMVKFQETAEWKSELEKREFFRKRNA